MKKSILMLSLLLAGCDTWVVPKTIEVAEAKCQANGGLKHIVSHPSGNADAVCENGAEFDYILGGSL